MRVIYLLSIALLLFSFGCEHPQQLENTYKETPKESVVLPTLPGSSQTIMKWLRYPAISPDGKKVIVGDRNRDLPHRKLTGWEIETGKEILNISNDQPVNTLMFSPNGQSILVAGEETLYRDEPKLR